MKSTTVREVNSVRREGVGSFIKASSYRMTTEEKTAQGSFSKKRS